jgi:hypothetical protein
VYDSRLGESSISFPVHENADQAAAVEALRAQLLALGEEPVVGPVETIAGEQGERGDRGPRGPRGRDGADGEDGLNGADGIDGAPGPAGEAGATGATGPQGETGATGPAGPQGPAGPACPEGFTLTVIDQGPLAGWIACAPIQPEETQ